MSGITKAERAELRSVVKQQFKVLRSELEQREQEMYAEIEDQITDRFSEQDQQWDAMIHRWREIEREANRQVNDLLYEYGYQERGGSERQWVNAIEPNPPTRKRTDLRVQAQSKVKAQAKGARLRLDREEADLLRTLSVGALESDEARSFLESIPTVGELVPAARIAELESSLDEGESRP